MASPTLTYTFTRGLSEKIRIMLCVAGVEPFEEVFLRERDTFMKRVNSGDLLFSQIPLLEIDGLKLVQSGAIMRYLAARSSMYGANIQEQVRIDMLYEGSQDFGSPLLAPGYFDDEDVSIEKGKSAMSRYCPVFEKELEQNGGGYLVGSSMTLADVGLYEVLLRIVDYLGEDALNDYTHLQKFVKMMKSDERIQIFWKKYRKPKYTEEMIAEVKRLHTKPK